MKDVRMSPGMKEMLESMNRIMGSNPPKPSFMKALFPIRDKAGEQPCGECHLQPGETCDICNATQA